MNFDWKTIGLWAAIWLVGYALGLLEGWVKNKTCQNELAALREASLTPPTPPPAPEIPRFEPEEVHALVISEEPAGAFKLKIDGQMAADKADLTAEQRKRLIALVVGLRPWLESVKEKPVAAPPAPATPRASLPTPTSPQPLIKKVVVEEKEYANLSMVEQIDWFLQKKLLGHPLEKHGISLRTSAAGGVLVLIGENQFNAIDEVPDPAIEEIIRAAIHEWESKATPGR